MGPDVNENHFALSYLNVLTNESYEVKFNTDYTENLYNLFFYVFYRCNTTNNNTEGICELNDDEKDQLLESMCIYLEKLEESNIAKRQ